MFDEFDDVAVLDAVTSSMRDENAACARRLAGIGELYARRAPEDDVDRECWAIDGYANVVAEISAAMRISRGRGAAQLQYAIALREELPEVAKVFASGAIDFRMMAAIVNRTSLIDDPERMASVDAALARHVVKWMRFSAPKLIERIDMWIARFDPAGVKQPKKPTEDRFVDIGPTMPGMAGISANVEAPDAAVLEQVLDGLAATVCPDDPRTQAQRRADAIGALADYRTSLTCRCGSADCPAAGNAPPRKNIVVHVMADPATVAGTSEMPGYLPGFGALAAEQVRDLAATAKVKPLVIPPPIAEPGYRPSAALAEFIRLRDLTCRWPGCDQPAEVCQVDHTIPWPFGPTHPSNTKLYCPHHHLIKTFWTGKGGWKDQQLPDGTVILTSPSGQTYTTKPAGALFFPCLGTPTGTIEVAVTDRTDTTTTVEGVGRGLMMPRRRRTRAQDRAERIAAERRVNEERIAEERREHEERIADNYEAPPF